MEQVLLVSGLELFKIGSFTASLGLKGELRLISDTLSYTELLDLLSFNITGLYLCGRNIFPKKVKIIKTRIHKNNIVASLANVTSKNEAEELVGLNAYIELSVFKDFLKLTNNVLRLEGYRVRDVNLGELGLVKRVIRSAQEIIVLDDINERMFPFVPDLIESLDDDNKLIITKLPDGIFEQ